MLLVEIFASYALEMSVLYCKSEVSIEIIFEFEDELATLLPDVQKRLLYVKQNPTLDTFLVRRAISQQ